MGICLSVAPSDQIYSHSVESDHGNENAIIVFDNQNDLSDDQTIHSLGSVHSEQGSKGLNQDYAILHQGLGAEGRVFCAVFDGHGNNGHFASEMVRNRLPILVLDQTDKAKKVTDEEITSAFKAMDKEIKAQESSNLDFSTSGTTAVVAIRQEDNLILANLGDSRAVLGTITENRINAVQLTTDLKPGLPCEEERIRVCKGRVLALRHEPHIQRVWLPHEDRPGLAMSRSFGDFLLKDHGIIAIPEVSSYRISSSDQFVVLATDGIWDVMSNDQVVATVWKSMVEGSKEAAARAVVEAAKLAWKKKFPNAKVDDCTVVCLFLQDNNRNVVAVKS